MVLVDYRAGSCELIKPLAKMGLPVETVDLPFGDIAFTGRGVGGAPVEIGIEFKKLGECVASMRSGRLQGHQRPGMYGVGGMYDFCWLLVEGETLHNKQGILLRRKGRSGFALLPGTMGVSEFFKRLQVLHLCGGLNPWLTPGRPDTLKWIEALYRTWTDEDLDKHKSHLAIYQAPTLVPMSKVQQAMAAWPHLGFKGSLAAERHFGSLQRAVNASAAEWAEITTEDKGKTRRLGTKNAASIVQFLQGR